MFEVLIEAVGKHLLFQMKICVHVQGRQWTNQIAWFCVGIIQLDSVNNIVA